MYNLNRNRIILRPESFDSYRLLLPLLFIRVDNINCSNLPCHARVTPFIIYL